MKNSLKFGLIVWVILTATAALLLFVYFNMPKKDEELGFAAGFATMSWFITSWGMMMFFTSEDETKEEPKKTTQTPRYIWVQKTKEVPSATDEK